MIARRWISRILACAMALGLTCALPLHAQSSQGSSATLIADQVSVTPGNDLEAIGNVEVFFGDTQLRATRIFYDADKDELIIDGPITLTQADGATVILASSAALSPDMRNGLLRSARVVLDQQIQIAASQVHRVEGRYTVMDRTIASSCRICAGSDTPLWQIRARRIIHDQDEQQLYFDHARLELGGVPVFYVPRLRLPDPTLDRATGFLIPKLTFTNDLGIGLKLPYFVRIGDHADVTLTPYISDSRTTTVELRYRQAFATGDIEFNGAVSRDDILPGQTRSYVFGEGEFDLPAGFGLEFGLQYSSDPAYLLDYDYSNADRLLSFVEVDRTTRYEQINAALLEYETLRASENNNTIPSTMLEASWERRLTNTGLGGVATVKGDVFAFQRDSSTDIAGRDVARASLSADWQRGWTLASGMQVATLGELALDYYGVADDSGFPDPVTRTTPFGAVELRWPMAKQGGDGASYLLEPVIQLVWSKSSGGTPPNEDSLSVEFDEGNLYSLSRFSGTDEREEGFRANIGLTWTRFDADGWSMAGTLGRVIRDATPTQFPAGSGLDSLESDWLAAVQFWSADQLRLTNRAVFDDSFSFTRNELRLDWQNDSFDIGSSLIWQEANIADNRPSDSSEWLMDAAYRFRRNWTGTAEWRYDFIGGQAAQAGLGLEYRNECISVDLSLSRRFTSSTNIRPSTQFGLTVELEGFGGSNDNSSYSRSCYR